MSAPLELLFLGSGNGFAQGRFYSSFLVNDRYLFDASPAVVPVMKQQGAVPADIEAIFISHFHADHLFGLPFLILDYVEAEPRERDLAIIGPPGLETRVRALLEVGLPGTARRSWPFTVRYCEVADGRSEEVAGVSYVAREVQHAAHFACFGYRMEIGGRVLSYSGDSGWCDALVALGDGADVFVLECSTWETPPKHHLGPDDIRELRRRLGPRPTFVLTHLDAGERELGVENVILAQDFERLSL